MNYKIKKEHVEKLRLRLSKIDEKIKDKKDEKNN
jgi:hypothetical protein